MKSTVEPIEGNRVKLTVTIPASEVDEAIAAAYTDVAKQVRVPGFRKGRAPRPVIDTYVGRDQVLAQAREKLIERTYTEGIDAEKLRPIDQPDLGELSEIVEGEEYQYVAEVEVRPELELTGDWKKLTAEVPPKAVSDEDVDAQLEGLRERFASLEPVEERGIEIGDFALISFVGLVDGEPYEGNTVDKYLYETGRGQMPQEFEDALVGAKAGDTVTATFAIPETSSNAEFVGKTATFEITVHEIKAKQLPEMDDEFAANAAGMESMDELRTDLRGRLQQQRDFQSIQEREKAASEALAAHLEGEAPSVMVTQRRDNMVRDFFNNLQQRGISLKDYVNATGVDPEQIQKDIEEEAAARVKQDLALESLFRAEGMEITDADIDAEIAGLASSAEKSVEELRREWEEAGVLAVIEEQVMHRKAVDWLLANVEFVEVKPGSGEKSAEAEPAKPKKARKSAKQKEE